MTEFSSSSTTLGVAGPPQEGRPDTALFVSEGPQCMTGFSSSSATREQGHATGLYSGIGVYPCSASLGFRGSPTPHPQEVATSQPTSSMKDLFCSFMDCVSAFNPSFAAKFAPAQACRGSIPAALGAPPPVSVSSASTPPFENLGGRAPAVSAPPPDSHTVGLQVPLSAQSRSGFDPTPSPFPRFTPPPVCFPSAFPSLSVSGTGVRVSAAHCLVSSTLSAVPAQSTWDNPPSSVYGFSEPSHPPAQDYYPDDPGEELYAESESLDTASANKSDKLGQVAVKLLRKYLDQIYNPVSAQPSEVNSASVSDAGFFQPPPTTQSGITIPPDFLTEFDRVFAKPNPHPLSSPTAPLAGFRFRTNRPVLTFRLRLLHLG